MDPSMSVAILPFDNSSNDGRAFKLLSIGTGIKGKIVRLHFADSVFHAWYKAGSWDGSPALIDTDADTGARP